MKKYIVLLLAAFCSHISPAQNLTGTWLGEGNDYRIVLIQVGDSCFGYTYDTGMGYCKANFIGTYKSSDKKLKGTNPSFIERTLTHSLSSYRFNYSKEGDAEFLRGSLRAKSTMTKILSFGIGMPVSYRKVSDKFDTTTFMAAKLSGKDPILIQEDSLADVAVVAIDTAARQPVISRDTPVIQPVVAEDLNKQKESRQSRLVNTITTGADSLRLTLHDNGEIDNDTVTVFLNGQIIVNRLGLTARAYETFIPLKDKDAIYSIELMANNLGSIPPNTAYLTIYAGKQKYELRVASDFTQNARIDVKYDPAKK